MKLTIKQRILAKFAPESLCRARKRIKNALKQFAHDNVSTYKFYQAEHGHLRDKKCYEVK